MKRTALPILLVLLLACSTGAASAVDFVSVGEGAAILYDAPSLKAKKLFVVTRYMPFEQVVELNNWVKVRDHSGGLYWIEKRALGNRRYVFAMMPLVDVRAAPDFGATRVIQVRQKVALEWLADPGAGWVKVRHADGEVGYLRNAEIWGD